MRSFWTEPMEHLLVACWTRGDSTLTSAKELSAKFPEHGRSITVGSIASKIAQLRRKGFELPPRSESFQRERRERFKIIQSAKSAKKAAAAERGRRRRGNPLSLLELERDMCRWPVDVNGKTMFCARTTGDCETYCEEHARLAWRRPKMQPMNSSVSKTGEADGLHRKHDGNPNRFDR